MQEFFKFKELNTNYKTEIIGGLTTFVTMAYVLAVVPKMLTNAGFDIHTALVLVSISIIISTLAMGIFTNRPFAIAPGLGSVAVAVSMVSENSFSTGVMAGAIFLSGIIFMLVTFLGLRQLLINAIPPALKYAISASVGLYIAFIGARSAGLIVAGKKSLVWGDLASKGVLVCVFGFIILLILQAKKVPASIIISIILSTILSILIGHSQMPSSFFALPMNPISAISQRISEFDFLNSLSFSIIPFVIALFIPDFFSTFGTILGVGTKAGFFDKNANMQGIDKCFKIDASATAAAGIVGVPCLCTYLESSAGVVAGARSGFSMLVVSFCFLLAMFFTPLAIMVPSAASAPAIIYIGICMFMGINKINNDDFTEMFPVFVCVVFTILASNIANGICVAIPVYVLLKIAKKDFSFSPLLYVMCFISFMYFYTLIAR